MVIGLCDHVLRGGSGCHCYWVGLSILKDREPVFFELCLRFSRKFCGELRRIAEIRISDWKQHIKFAEICGERQNSWTFQEIRKTWTKTELKFCGAWNFPAGACSFGFSSDRYGTISSFSSASRARVRLGPAGLGRGRTSEPPSRCWSRTDRGV